MKKTLATILCLCMFCLSACSGGISQEEYDTLLAKSNSLESEIESLTAENQSLSDSYKELLDEKAEQVLEEMDKSYVYAWITTSYGDTSTYLVSENYVQCIAGKTYSITSNGIGEIYSDFLESFKTLSLLKDSVQYDGIAIKFMNDSGICIMEFQLANKNGSYQLGNIMCNAMYADTIIPALTKSINQSK